MPTQFLSPNVFIEEVSSTVQTTPGISPSTAAFVGFTVQGPTEDPKLVTSFDEYVRLFGSFHKDSYMTHNVAAYFSNGGRRAYIDRVIPSDAVSSTASIQSLTTKQLLNTGNGAATLYTQAVPAVGTTFKANSGASHIVPGSATISYRAARTAVSSHHVRVRANTTALTMATGVSVYEGRVDTKAVYVSSAGTGKVLYRSVTDDNTAITVTQVDSGVNPTALSIVVVGNAITVNLAVGVGPAVTSSAADVVAAIGASTAASALITAEVHTAGTMAAAGSASLNGMPVFNEGLNAIVADTFTLSWTAATVAKSITFPGVTGGSLQTPIATTTNAAGSSISLDLRTGFFSLETVSGETPAAGDNGAKFTVAYTPASSTITLTSGTSVNTSGQIDVSGSPLTGSGGIANSCFINVATGDWSLSFQAGATNIPSQKTKLLVNYKIAAWELTPISKGAWGDNLRVQVRGSTDFFSVATSTYTRHNLFVLLKDSDGVYQLRETFEDLDFATATSPMYFADVINDLSELINVTTPAGNEAPLELHGISRTQVIAGGDETSNNRTISATLSNPVVAVRTVTISFTNTSGTVRTITDDGSGNLTGFVDSTYTTTVSGLGPNKINYTTGAVNFRTSEAIGGGSLVSVSYYTTPTETVHTESFGDTAKDYVYTITPTTFSFYIAGANGTFGSANYGRDQFTISTLAPTFQGVYALDKVEEILQVCVPDFAGDVAITSDLLDYADTRAAGPQGGDRFIILTVPIGSTSTEAVDWFKFQLVQFSNFAAMYWPWVKVSDPLSNNRPLTIPPLGHIAGVYARTDANSNVGKGPGGNIDGQLSYLVGLESIPTLTDRDLVYPNKINPIITTSVNGTAVWGVRTISNDSRWKLINARRLFMYVEKSVYTLIQWAVFENNGPILWSKLKLQLSSYLNDLFTKGYFAGTKPSEAFRVIVDSTNNTQDSVNEGKLNISIALKPFKSTEFIVVSFSQILDS